MCKPLRVLLVDDEPLALRGLELRLAKIPDAEIAGTCTNGRDAISACVIHKPDVVFLDIQMPVLDGFDVLGQMLSRGDLNPLIIFVTAFDEHAVRAFRANAFDYLLKPVDDESLAGTVARAKAALADRRQVSQSQRLMGLITQLRHADGDEFRDTLMHAMAAMENDFAIELSIRDRGRITKVDIEAVDMISAERDYIRIWTDGKSYLLRETMKDIEQRLNPAIFARVHRSTIVNLKRVNELRVSASGAYVLALGDNQEVRVGRSYKRRIARHFSDLNA